MGTQPQPRSNHLTDAITHRDIFGTVRGSCIGCTSCGRYVVDTKRQYTSAFQAGPGQGMHPDNDLRITRCSRCGCPPEAHIEERHETEKELGNDAYALREVKTKEEALHDHHTFQ